MDPVPGGDAISTLQISHLTFYVFYSAQMHIGDI